MLTLYFNVRFSRRKGFHHIMDDAGKLLFTSIDPGDCFAWLWENHHPEVRVVGNAGAYTVKLIHTAY